MSDSPKTDLMTEIEAAEYLTLSVHELRKNRARAPRKLTHEIIEAEVRARRLPPIPFIRMGRLVRYSRRALDKWIADQPVWSLMANN